ncbi:hypothetical protein KFK09_023888 [Dendrobium nobile]|uniref:Uncharacterized protein n=1 Tax=Dendrobium nobile TaxID=94219 RepID=A0A8T3ACG5_DENNO|nr:hypothetical protein KFK09_023888 [Dendrobium nobile]
MKLSRELPTSSNFAINVGYISIFLSRIHASFILLIDTPIETFHLIIGRRNFAPLRIILQVDELIFFISEFQISFRYFAIRVLLRRESKLEMKFQASLEDLLLKQLNAIHGHPCSLLYIKHSKQHNEALDYHYAYAK